MKFNFLSAIAFPSVASVTLSAASATTLFGFHSEVSPEIVAQRTPVEIAGKIQGLAVTADHLGSALPVEATVIAQELVENPRTGEQLARLLEIRACYYGGFEEAISDWESVAAPVRTRLEQRSRSAVEPQTDSELEFALLTLYNHHGWKLSDVDTIVSLPATAAPISLRMFDERFDRDSRGHSFGILALLFGGFEHELPEPLKTEVVESVLAKLGEEQFLAMDLMVLRHMRHQRVLAFVSGYLDHPNPSVRVQALETAIEISASLASNRQMDASDVDFPVDSATLPGQ